MSNQPNINLNQGIALPSAAVGGQKSSSNSALFQPGMIGLTSAALLNVMQLFTKIADLEGEQFVKQIESAKTTATYLGEYQSQVGVQEFKQYLVQGINQIVGGAISLGTLYVSEKSIASESKLSETQEQLKGVQNYQDAVNARLKTLDNPSLSENPYSEADRGASQIKSRLEQLAAENNFVDSQGKALKVANRTGNGINANDKEIIETLSKPQAQELLESLNEKAKDFRATERQQLETQAASRQTASTIGQGLSQITSGTGTAASAQFSAEKAKQQAAATQAQAALQGEQQMGQNTQGQFTKAVQSAAEIEQNLASISAANALR